MNQTYDSVRIVCRSSVVSSGITTDMDFECELSTGDGSLSSTSGADSGVLTDD